MEIEIALDTSQIKLDVATETRKTALMLMAEDNPEGRIEASLGEEPSDMAYFSRREKQAVDALAALLHKYVKRVYLETMIGDELTDDADTQMGTNLMFTSDEDVVFTHVALSLDLSPRRAALPYVLAGMAHKYVVYYILHAWAMMTMPQLTAAYLEQRESAAREILNYVTRKHPPTT